MKLSTTNSDAEFILENCIEIIRIVLECFTCLDDVVPYMTTLFILSVITMVKVEWSTKHADNMDNPGVLILIEKSWLSQLFSIKVIVMYLAGHVLRMRSGKKLV